MKRKCKRENGLLPFHTIKAATEGNVEAINAVLKHYEGYKQACLSGNYMMNMDSRITVWMNRSAGGWKQS